MIDKSQQVAAIEAAMVALRRMQRRRTLARLSQRRGARAEGHGGLPDAVFELLDVLAGAAERGGRLTVTEAAAQLGVDQPRASRLAATALEAALVRREADQDDGRRSLLVLTPDGKEAMSRIHQFRQQVIAEATGDWSDDDRAALARLLPRLVHDLGAAT